MSGDGGLLGGLEIVETVDEVDGESGMKEPSVKDLAIARIFSKMLLTSA